MRGFTGQIIKVRLEFGVAILRLIVIFGGSTLANIKSQIKRNRQNEKRRLRNRVTRGTARKAVAKTRDVISTGEEAKSREAVLTAVRALDKAAEKGIIHKNNAARRKSRLMKRLATLEQ
jgi:small subunit ribosomal protein S20